MSEDRVTMTEVERATLDGVLRHRTAYLESGGRDGHIRDFTALGGHFLTTTLLLETTGRKTGERRITPLIYGDIGGEVAIVASKGGADVHPAWYWNLMEMETVAIQIAAQAFTCTWREPSGQERDHVWNFMAQVYPPYYAYQDATTREIPIVLFKTGRTIPVFQDT